MTIDQAAKTIIGKYLEMPAKHSMLVGISGIDASGRGYVTRRLSRELNSLDTRTTFRSPERAADNSPG